MSLSKVSLAVNDFDVPIVEFIQEFIGRVVVGMLSALKGVNEIYNVVLSINGDEVHIEVNNTTVPSNDFVNIFVKNTVIGMVTSLKDVERVDKLEITIAD